MKKKNVILFTVMGILIFVVCIVIIGKINSMNKQKYSLYPLEDVKIDEDYTIGGKVSILASISEKTSEYLLKQLEKAFPDVTVTIDCLDNDTIRKTLMSEKQGQNIGYDIIIADGTYLAAYLKEQGVLQAYKTPAAKMLVEYYDMDGYWYPLGMNQMVLVYNPDLYTKNMIANSFRGLIDDPKMYRKIAIPDPENDIAGLTTVVTLGTYYGTEYYDGIVKQEISLVSADEGIEKLADGVYKVMVLDEKTALKRKADGAEIEILYPTDLRIGMPLINMIIKEEYSANKNVEICEMITDWFMSRNGQKCFLGEYFRSIRSDMNKTYNAKNYEKEFKEEIWQSEFSRMYDVYTEFCKRVLKDE